MSTDTTEKGLETLVVRHMTGGDGLAVAANAPQPTPDAAGSEAFVEEGLAK